MRWKGPDRKGGGGGGGGGSVRHILAYDEEEGRGMAGRLQDENGLRRLL